MAEKTADRKARSTQIFVALIGATALIGAALITNHVWSGKAIKLAIFVKDRSTERGIRAAQVILQRPAKREERTTDGLGTARFEFPRDADGTYRVIVRAAGYSDESREIDAPHADSNHEIYLDPIAILQIGPGSASKSEGKKRLRAKGNTTSGARWEEI